MTPNIIAVFESHFRPITPQGGMAIIPKKDRQKVLQILEQHVPEGSDLESEIRFLFKRRYHNRNKFSKEIDKNIELYLSGAVGIGLNVLGDICRHLNITTTITVSFPDNMVRVVFYGT